MPLTEQDVKDLAFVTRDDAVDVVIRLMEQRDELLQACADALQTFRAIEKVPPRSLEKAIAKATS